MDGKCARMVRGADVTHEYDDVYAEEYAAGALGRDAILGAQDADIAYVAVPEWGGGVFIRTMTGRQRDDIEKRITAGETLTRARIAVLCCCDETGKPLFSEDDIDALNEKCAAALDRILDAAVEHNNLRGQDIEEAAKN